VIIELAAFDESNKMGVFDLADPTKKVELFGGSATTGSQVMMSIMADGSVVLNIDDDSGVDFAGNGFGFYLDATVGNDNSSAIFYSETSLNADGYDHMYAYAGKNDEVQIGDFAAGTWTPGEYVLAFEDLYGTTSDWDYTDFVVMVESVIPVPVPAAVLLGILGLGVVGLKLRKHA
jgi:hypothetical protein